MRPEDQPGPSPESDPAPDAALGPLGTILEGMSDAVVMLDRAWRVTYLNPHAEQLIARPSTSLLGRDFWQEFPAAVGSEFDRQYRQALAQGTVAAFEAHYPRLDRSYAVRAYPSPSGITVVFRDTTADRAAATAHEERERLASLEAAVGRALTRADDLPTMLQHCAAALVTYADAAFARVWTLNVPTQVLELQASAGQYTHRDGPHGRIPLGQLKIGRIAQERRPHLTNAVIGDPEVSDQAWARREGMVAFAGYPLLVAEQLVGVVALFARQSLSAVTLTALATVADGIALGIARKRSEERLHEARTVQETLVAIGRTVAAELDTERVVQAVTDAATTLTGAQFGAFFYNVVNERGEAYTLYTISGVPREHFAQFPMPRNTPVFGPTFHGEGVVRLDDVTRDPRYGQMAPYHGMPPGHLPVRSYLAVPVLARAGTVLGGLFFGHAEPGRFRERDEELVVGIAAQAAVALDNARLFEQAQQAIRVRDQFLAVVSHDLRTPLATIMGLVQLGRRQAARLGTPEATRLAERLGTVDGAVKRMSGMIDELLDLTRLESGQNLALAQEETDLVALVRQVADEQPPPNVQLTIVVETALAGLIGVWDANRLRRVVENLIANAVKYSPQGGVVTLRLDAVERSTGRWAVLAVADQGLGIPSADLPHIFERYYRATNVVGRIRGIGLGLAGSRQVVEQHGGVITVASEEGRGSTFTLALPCQPPRTADGTE